ncbi:M15 family metallopeptidase [Bacteroides sp.]|uniref:M15 family metallopeptidase n=1 Tax=Bacteroides sp. TaxID=29523 RepID=UPI0026154470|nr:M15 family metallopeptidase [Bacteroides sp.]MDD3036855.1 M15 family metallopeptidase [Bacteroides sp.]
MGLIKYNVLVFWLVLFFSCSYTPTKEKQHHIESIDSVKPVTSLPLECTFTKSRTALTLDSLGFVNISELDSTIHIDLMYTRADNFTGEILYDDLNEAYLHPDAAQALAQVQKGLKELHPSYSLIVYDAARPMSVQKKMWNVVKGTSKFRYVSNPNHGGGLHNYGLAVDIGILDSLNIPLPMGTKIDHLGIEAHITQEVELVQTGKISEKERQNRILLRTVMKKAGFRPLPSEWWHFNLCSREEARRKHKLIP